MAPAEDEVTYESLVNQWKKELRSHTLTKIDPHFYQMVDARLRQLQEEYQREHAVASNTPKVMILQDELRNLTRSRDDLYDLREKKIATSAIVAARGGNPDRGNMTNGERDLYEELVRVLKEGRRALLKRGERMMRARDAAAAAAADAPPPDEATEPATRGGPPTPPEPLDEDEAREPAAATTPADEHLEPEPPREKSLPGLEPAPPAPPAPAEVVRATPVTAATTAPEPRSGRVLVHVLEEVAPFTASDLRTYHLHADDVVALPPDAAKALTARGVARPVVAPAS